MLDWSQKPDFSPGSILDWPPIGCSPVCRSDVPHLSCQGQWCLVCYLLGLWGSHEVRTRKGFEIVKNQAKVRQLFKCNALKRKQCLQVPRKKPTDWDFTYIWLYISPYILLDRVWFSDMVHKDTISKSHLKSHFIKSEELWLIDIQSCEMLKDPAFTQSWKSFKPRVYYNQ